MAMAYITGLKMLFEGTNGSTTMTDDGASAYAFTAYGNAALSTVRAKFGSSSLALDGTGDYVMTTAVVTSGALYQDLDSANYTLDLWIYLTAVPGADACIFSKWGAGTTREFWIGVDSSGYAKLKYRAAGADSTVTSTTTITLNQWVHIRFQKEYTSIGMAVDGVWACRADNVSTWAVAYCKIGIGQSEAGGDTISACNIDAIWLSLNNAAEGFNTFTPPSALPTAEVVTTSGNHLSMYNGVVYGGGGGANDGSRLDMLTVVVGDATASSGLVPTEAWSGTVTNLGVPVQRTIRAFIRATGEIISETTSNPTTGAFTILLVPNVEHFVVCFDDDAAPVKNDLIKRKMITV